MVDCENKDCECNYHRMLCCMKRSSNDEAAALLQSIKLPVAGIIESTGKTLLHYAVEYDNIKMIQYLIDEGCEINVQNKYGITPLMQVVDKMCQTSNVPLIKVLLKNNADIFVSDVIGVSALERTIRNYISNSNKKIKLVKNRCLDDDIRGWIPHYHMKEELWLNVNMLIEKANKDFLTDKESTLRLILDSNCAVKAACVAMCNIELAKIILQNDKNYQIIQYRGVTMGFTALHFLSIGGNFENANLLIEFGANVNAPDNTGLTPLMFAIKTGNVQMVDFFLKNNADIFVVDNKNLNALGHSFYANIESKSSKKHSYILDIIANHLYEKFLSDKESTTESLLNCDSTVVEFFCVTCCNVELASLISQNGSMSIDSYITEQRLTPLHCAVIFGKIENFKWLIEHGANVDAVANKFQPLFYYLGKLESVDEDSEVLKILLQYSTEKYITHLLETGTQETVKTVLESDIEIIEAELNYRPLQDVLMANNQLKPNDIIDLGIFIDANQIYPNDYGTPLFREIARENIEKIEFLLEQGANVNFSTDKYLHMTQYCSPLTFSALVCNSSKIVELLLQYGAEAQIDLLPNQNFIGCLLQDYYKRQSQKDSTIIKSILAHLAMIAKINPLALEKSTLNSIMSYEMSKSYFNVCIEQLENLERTILYEKVTVLKLLHENEEEILQYARNQQQFNMLINTAIENMPHLESYYVNILKKRVSNFKKQNL